MCVHVYEKNECYFFKKKIVSYYVCFLILCTERQDICLSSHFLLFSYHTLFKAESRWGFACSHLPIARCVVVEDIFSGVKAA